MLTTTLILLKMIRYFAFSPPLVASAYKKTTKSSSDRYGIIRARNRARAKKNVPPLLNPPPRLPASSHKLILPYPPHPNKNPQPPIIFPT